TLLHVTSEEGPDAARGAYAGLLGRGSRDPAARLAEEAAASGTRLLQAAAARLRQGIGRGCDRLGLQGRAERVVVAASAQADLLDVVFGWADFARLRRLFWRQCAGPAGHAEPGEPIGADGGRGLWLAAMLADELRITFGPSRRSRAWTEDRHARWSTRS